MPLYHCSLAFVSETVRNQEPTAQVQDFLFRANDKGIRFYGQRSLADCGLSRSAQLGSNQRSIQFSKQDLDVTEIISYSDYIV
jgi:hypothetical protein